MPADDVRRLLDAYPRIWFACHVRHVSDPRARGRLSSHQASILDHLDAVHPICLKDLASHMGIKPSAMSLAVERLVALGYLLRALDPNDRRRVCLRLSAAGLRIKETKSVLDPRLVAALLDQLEPAERERALAGLETLARAA